MGQFNAGTWIVGLLIYFTLFFTIVYCVAAAVPTSGVSYSDPGYGASPSQSTSITDINSSGSVSTSTPGMSNVMTTLSIITGVGSGSYQIGMPGGWDWLFSFFMFYLPFFMLLWSIYMALPIIH